MSFAMKARERDDENPWASSAAGRAAGAGTGAGGPFAPPFAREDRSLDARMYRTAQSMAHKDLEGRFEIMPEGFIGPRLPNQVSQGEYDEACMYLSGYQQNGQASNLQRDAGSPADHRAMTGDIASLLQTPEGREVFRQLSTAQGADGQPHTTHLEATHDAKRAGASAPATIIPPDGGEPIRDSYRHMYDGVGTSMFLRHVPGQATEDAEGSPMTSDANLYHDMLFAMHGTQGDVPRQSWDKMDQGPHEQLPSIWSMLDRYRASSKLVASRTAQQREAPGGPNSELFRHYSG